jgi:putative hydrolase of the HAD superfamily
MTTPGPRNRNRHPYSTVLFDLDNTLGDRPAAVRRWAEKFYFSQPGVMAKVERTEAVEQIIRWDAGGHVFAKELFTKMVEVWPYVRESVDELVKWHAVNYPAAFRPEPVMGRTVARMMRAGIEWGVVTNGPAFQRDKLVALGLDKLAGCVLISSEFGEAKPEPEIFKEALRRLHGKPETSLFVGDSPAADIEGARKVGMDTAWMSLGRRWPAELRPPTHSLTRFADLSNVLGL